MGKAFEYFFLGFLAGLIFVELTDGKPAVKANHDEINRHYTSDDVDIYSNEDIPHQDTFNSQRPSESENENNGKKN